MANDSPALGREYGDRSNVLLCSGQCAKPRRSPRRHSHWECQKFCVGLFEFPLEFRRPIAILRGRNGMRFGSAARTKWSKEGYPPHKLSPNNYIAEGQRFSDTRKIVTQPITDPELWKLAGGYPLRKTQKQYDVANWLSHPPHLRRRGPSARRSRATCNPRLPSTRIRPTEAAAVLRSRFADRSNALGVNLSNGSLGYSSPVSL